MAGERTVLPMALGLVLLLICFNVVICNTIHYVDWNIDALATINNRVSVCSGDVVNISCIGCQSSLILAENITSYDTCTTGCGSPFNHIGSFLLKGYITINAVSVSIPFNCHPNFVEGGSVYFFGDTTNSCQTSFKLEVFFMTNGECIDESSSTPSSSTTAGTNQNTVNSVITAMTSTSSYTTNTGNNPTTIITASTDGTCCTGSISVTPTLEGTVDRNRFFVDYSIGIKIGIIAGGVVIVIILLFVIVGVVMCIVKSNRTEKVTLAKDDSKANMLDDTDHGRVIKFDMTSSTSSGHSTDHSTPINKVKPMPSPNRRPPLPPQNGNSNIHTNGNGSTSTNYVNTSIKQTEVYFNKEQDEASVISPKRPAPLPPNRSVSQSVQNFNKNKPDYSHQLKTIS